MGRLVTGKLLELFGLAIVTAGFFLGISGHIHLHLELLTLTAGATMFGIGYLLERPFRKP